MIAGAPMKGAETKDFGSSERGDQNARLAEEPVE